LTYVINRKSPEAVVFKTLLIIIRIRKKFSNVGLDSWSFSRDWDYRNKKCRIL